MDQILEFSVQRIGASGCQILVILELLLLDEDGAQDSVRPLNIRERYLVFAHGGVERAQIDQGTGNLAVDLAQALFIIVILVILISESSLFNFKSLFEKLSSIIKLPLLLIEQAKVIESKRDT